MYRPCMQWCLSIVAKFQPVKVDQVWSKTVYTQTPVGLNYYNYKIEEHQECILDDFFHTGVLAKVAFICFCSYWYVILLSSISLRE